jgi:hypothetical protein
MMVPSASRRPERKPETPENPAGPTLGPAAVLARNSAETGPACQSACQSDPERVPLAGGTEDDESTLLRTIDQATAAGAWEVVSQALAELRERRLARSGVAVLPDRARRRR